jgi:hypothetical protein
MALAASPNDTLNMTTPPGDDDEDEETTLTGIPVRLLWVPYCALGLVLVVLMLASFLRYHCKHGHKYQQRRLELWKKFNMEGLIDQLQQQQQDANTQHHQHLQPPNGGLQLSPSPSTSQRIPDPPQPLPPPPKSTRRPRKSRKPPVFESNANGSMVDIRCSQQLRTFPPNPHPPPPPSTSSVATDTDGLSTPGVPLLPPGPSPSTQSIRSKASPVIWTLSRPRDQGGRATKTPASFFSSPMDIQPDEIEAEDDEVLLLQQTPL